MATVEAFKDRHIERQTLSMLHKFTDIIVSERFCGRQS